MSLSERNRATTGPGSPHTYKLMTYAHNEVITLTTSGQLNFANRHNGCRTCPDVKSEVTIGFYIEIWV